MGRRTLPTVVSVLSLASAALAGCGGGPSASATPAPGTPENPLVAQKAEPSADGGAQEPSTSSEPPAQGEPSVTPGYGRLVENQASSPQSRFTPCNLVTENEAQSILGVPVRAPLEAPQGPTCLYRTRTGNGQIALAVQTADFGAIKRKLRSLRRVAVGDREAYCGTYGQPMLYLPLSSGRVLSVAAQCDVATSFATKALSHL